VNIFYHVGKWGTFAVILVALLIAIITIDPQRKGSTFMEHWLVMTILGLDVIVIGLHRILFARRYTQEELDRIKRLRQANTSMAKFALWFSCWSPLTLRILSYAGGAFCVFVGTMVVRMGLERCFRA
jgi:hypothetical protein